MNSILTNIPDKRIDRTTTSLKFKQDLIDFFLDKKLDNCLEIGTCYGYSTYVLSNLFKCVFTIDIDINNINRARLFNIDNKNINYLLGDSTNSDYDVDIKFDVSFIDADHRYECVIKDIHQSIKYGTDNLYIIFDDYGLPEQNPAVKVAVDECIQKGILEKIQYIGESKGSEPRIGKPLVDWEGIITKVTK